MAEGIQKQNSHPSVAHPANLQHAAQSILPRGHHDQPRIIQNGHQARPRYPGARFERKLCQPLGRSPGGPEACPKDGHSRTAGGLARQAQIARKMQLVYIAPQSTSFRRIGLLWCCAESMSSRRRKMALASASRWSSTEATWAPASSIADYCFCLSRPGVRMRSECYAKVSLWATSIAIGFDEEKMTGLMEWSLLGRQLLS